MTEEPQVPGGAEPTAPPAGVREGEHTEGIRFRDNRKIDPETLQPRSAPAGPAAPTPADEESADAPDERVAELTADLQRLSAEYANYRKRVDRDREVNRDRAVAAVVVELMPILDDIGRARGHGELDGGFKAVADAVAAVAAKFGMVSFGEEGEPFDPHVHEAMTSQTSPDVTEPTVATVYQVGYRLRDQILRPARVAVADTE